jgi:hypothetical protein
VCRDAVVAHVRWAQRLLTAEQTDAVRARLHLAVADLHGLAGWTSFDAGLCFVARRHLARAVEQARRAAAPGLVAALSDVADLHAHRGLLADAAKFVQLGQISAREAGDGLTLAVLCCTEAVVHARLGEEDNALTAVRRAQDAFLRADTSSVPGWVGWFGLADLQAWEGFTHHALAQALPRHVEPAVEALRRSLGARGPDRSRTRAFELAALATVLLHAGEVDDGVAAGVAAVDLAGTVHSARVRHRLEPLLAEARSREGHDDHARELATRIVQLRPAQPTARDGGRASDARKPPPV